MAVGRLGYQCTRWFNGTWKSLAGLSALLGLVGLVAGMGILALLVHVGVQAAAERAMERSPGDRVEALVKSVDCAACSIAERNPAVWALGVIGDPRALPALRKHHTGEKCDHAERLCQYELQKAIRKIEGTWDISAALGRFDAQSDYREHR